MLVGESSEEVNSRFEEWKEAFESKGLRISRRKIKYLEFCFRGRIHKMNWQKQVMKKSVDLMGEV